MPISPILCIPIAAIVVVAPLVYIIYQNSRPDRFKPPRRSAMDEFRAEYGDHFLDKYRRIYKPSPNDLPERPKNRSYHPPVKPAADEAADDGSSLPPEEG